MYLGRDQNGKVKHLNRRFHGSSKEADAFLRDLISQHADSSLEGLGMTFGQLLDRWLVECERLDRSPTTLRTYRSEIEKTIRPAHGKVKLSQLGPRQLDELYGEMKANRRSAKTIRNHHAIISSALHQAVRWGWVRENVAERARPPAVGHSRVTAPSVDEVRAVVVAAEEKDPRLAPLLMLAALTGMRRGELCALRWTDLDLEHGVIEVARSLIVTPGGTAEKSTKTNRERRVALDEVAILLLRAHRENVLKWAGVIEVALPSDGFVFSPYLDGHGPFRPDNVTGFFTRVRDSLGLKHVRLHDLRHFTATQLIGAGVDVRTVAGWLGHSDPSLTLRVYSHAIEERDRAAASIMGNVLGRPALTPPSD